MIRFLFYLLFLIAQGLIVSCNRIKAKSKEVLHNAKEKVIEKKDLLADKVIRQFDAYTPDTKFNKKRFTEFFKFEPTPDVKNLYCFGDMMGIDSKFQFSFNCDTATADRIIKNLKMKQCKEPDNFSEGLWQSYPWWDSAKISNTCPWLKKSEHELYQYLWYDTTKKKAYYFDFDL